MNKAKAFFGAVLLTQLTLNTAAPVFANPYNPYDYEQNNFQYNDTSSSTENIENDTSFSEMAVLGLLGGLALWSIFGGGGDGGSSSDQHTQDNYYYRDNTSAPSYTSSPEPVKPISPFYGSCHSYDC